MSDALQRLLEIMRQLRDPQTGCAWDREQTFDSIVPHTLEEAYEVADAIATAVTSSSDATAARARTWTRASARRIGQPVREGSLS